MLFHIYNYEQRNDSEIIIYGSVNNKAYTLLIKNIISDVYFLPSDDSVLKIADDNTTQTKLMNEISNYFSTNIKNIEIVKRKNIFHKTLKPFLTLIKVSFYQKPILDNFESEYCDFILTEFSNPIEQLIISKKMFGCPIIEINDNDIIIDKKIDSISIDNFYFVRSEYLSNIKKCSLLVLLQNNKIIKYSYYDETMNIIGSISSNNNKQNINIIERFFNSSEDLQKDLEILIKNQAPDLIITHNCHANKFIKLKKSLVCDIFQFSQGILKGKDFSIKELAEKYNIDYNDNFFEQTKIIYYLFDKMEIMSLAHEMSEISGFPIQKCFLNTRAQRIEYLLLHNLYENMFLFPLNKQLNTNQTYSGGLVFEPEKGFYNEIVLLLDFNSLYPSIIQEYNICFSTIDLLKIDKNNELDMNLLFLPKIINNLVRRRREIKKQMINCKNSEQLNQYNIRQKALKLTANSMYGCLGFPNNRFYNYDMAAFITEQGRNILKDTKIISEKLNLNVIYGDTDSIMIHTKYPGTREYYKKAKNSIEELAKAINNKYKNIVIELECAFAKLLLYAKKKYAGLVFNMNTSYIEIKGLEIVRRDYAKISTNLQEKVLKIILNENDIDYKIDNKKNINIEEIYKVCSNYYNNIETIKSENFIISVILRKNLEFYETKNPLPHINLGHRLSKKGINYKAGDVINYIMGKSTNATAEPYHPIEYCTIDYEWYIKNQILPPLYRLLSPIKEIYIEKIAMIFNVRDVEPLIENRNNIVLLSKCCKSNINAKQKQCTKCNNKISENWIYDEILNLLHINNIHKNYIGTCDDCGQKYTNSLIKCFYCKTDLKFDFKNKIFDDFLYSIELYIKDNDLNFNDIIEYYNEYSGYRKIDMFKYFKIEINRFNKE